MSVLVITLVSAFSDDNVPEVPLVIDPDSPVDTPEVITYGKLAT